MLLCVSSARAEMEDDRDFAFLNWLSALKIEAMHAGVSQDLVNKALHRGLQPKPTVVKLDKKQPEKVATFEYYKRRVVNDKRIEMGKKLYKENLNLLNRVSERYGVAPEFIVALWGIETNYGTNLGGYDVVPALVTLAYEGRREEFFKKELITALKIVDNGDVTLEGLKGSWAGAMGQCQFMPSSYAAYAVDYNGDGKKDIWGTKADVFASIANYLMKNGWKGNEPYLQRIELPKKFDEKLIDLSVKKSVGEWKKLGVTGIKGKELPDSYTQVSIVQPGGLGYKTYFAYDNYKAVMRWNKSVYFATSVGALSDFVKK